MDKKITLSLFLFVVCVFIMTPFSTQAQVPWDGTTDVSWFDDSQETFDISTPEQLAGIAELVNNEISDFTGKTIKLVADIWLNADNDSSQNWTPIGGYPNGYNGIDDAGTNSLNKYFQGTFDGNYHRIYNMFCDRTNSFHAGLFGAINSTSSSSSILKNLILINPVIKAKGMAGHIVGFAGSGGPAYIQNCQVINGRLIGSASGKNNGSIIGATWPAGDNRYVISLENCCATGSVSGACTGGLLGNGNSASLRNCYFAGTVEPVYDFYHGGLIGISEPGRFASVTNCYSNVSVGSSYSNSGNIKTLAEMQDPIFVAALGENIYKTDDHCRINNGYPILTKILCGVLVLGETDICSGVSTTLTAVDWDSYIWSTGETTASITVTPNTTTTYYVTGTTENTSIADSVVVNVHSDIHILTEIVPSSDGNTHGSITPGPSHSIACGSSAFVPISVNTDIGWYITEITVNGTTVEVFDPVDVITSYTYNLDVQASSLWDVKAHLNNEYTISSYAYVLNENSEENIIDAERLQLITPWGTNGILTINYPDTTTLYFNETEKYKIVNIEIDGISYNVIDSFIFYQISSHTVVKVRYEDRCAIETLPYEQGFFTSYYLSPCWTTPGSTAPYINTSHSYNTPYSLSFNANTNTVIAVAPKLDDQFYMQNLQVSFALKADNTSVIFEIGVMDDPDNALTFERVAFAPITSSNWETHTVYFNQYTGDAKYIAFRVPYGVNGLLHLDDVKIDFAPSCLSPNGLEISYIEETSALISWNSPEEDYGFIVEYEEAGTGNWTTLNTLNNSQALTSLNVGTPYNVRVLSDCFSDTIAGSFTTLCNPGGFVIGTPDDPTNTDGNFFLSNVYRKYSYTQQIYTAEELLNQPRIIKAIDFQYFFEIPYNRNYTIYLGHTSNTAINTTNDFIAPENLKQVFSGNITLNNQGDNFWMTFMLDSAFAYNGTDNLVVAIADRTGSWANKNDKKFRTHLSLNNENMAVYYSQDGTNISMSSPTSATYQGVSLYRTNIRFPDCNAASSCLSPNILTVSNTTTDQTEISWISEGSGIPELEYKATDSTAWEVIYGASSPELLNGLEPNTSYMVRVRTLCSNDTTHWITTSFTTQPICNTITIPFSENFDSYTANQYPPCWTRYTSGYNNLPYITINENHSEPSALAFGNTLSTYNMAILPPFESSVDLSTLQVSFWAKTNSPMNGTFLLGIMDDINNISSIEIVDTITNQAAYSWEEKTVNLNGYNGFGKYIAFVWQNGNAYNNFVIDDLYINTIPICENPENVVIDSVTTDRAYFSWNQQGDINSWTVEYGAPGFSPGQGQGTQVIVYTNESAEVNGLIDGTHYEIYVAANCEANSHSAWSNPIRFWSKQIPATLPYACDFEDASIAQKWCLENGSQKNQWYIGDIVNNTPGGNQALYISGDFGATSSYSGNTSYVYAYRLIHFADTGSYQLSFDWLCNGECAFDLLRAFLIPSEIVLVAGEDNGLNVNYAYTPNDWIDVGMGELCSNTIWESAFNTIQITTTGDYYLTFFWKNNANRNFQPPAQVDNILINKFSCPSPVNITLSSIGTTDATLTWEEENDIDEWEVIIVNGREPISSGTSDFIVGITPPSITFSELTPATDYDVYIRAVCTPGDTSRWTKYSFSTECNPIEIGNLPFMENFDNWPSGTSDHSAMPKCWNTFIFNPALNNHPYITNGSSDYNSSPNALHLNHTLNSYNLTILPELGTSINIQNLEIEFWTKMQNSNNGDLLIGVISDPEDGRTFIPTDTVTVRRTNQYEPIIRTFNHYQGTGRYLAIKWQIGENNTHIVDDLIVRVHQTADSCERPSGLQISNIDLTSADVSWTGGSEWEFRYKKSTDHYFKKQKRFTVNFCSLTELDINTTYEVQVRRIHSNGRVSEWVNGTFQTEDTCARPAGLTASNVTHNAATISWYSSPNANWKYSYKLSTDTDYPTAITTSSNILPLTDLASETAYDVQVSLVCNNGEESAWSEMTFTTKAAYIISATAGPNGRISPEGDTTVVEGSTPTFKFIPDAEFEVKSIQVNGVDVTPDTMYTFSPVQNNAAIHVEFQTIGIPAFELDQMVVVFPNPVKDKLNVKTKDTFENLEITNLMGQTIHTANITDIEFNIDISSYTSGVYFIRVKGKQGVVSKKFIKE